MPVKVLISRRVKQGMVLGLLNEMNQLRATAVIQPGYITGETLTGLDNPEKVLVICTWDGEEQWRTWKEDPIRKSYEARMEEMLLEPPQYEIFAYGALPVGMAYSNV